MHSGYMTNPFAHGHYGDVVSDPFGTPFIRQTKVDEMVAEAHDNGRTEIMLLLKQTQDIQMTLDMLVRENEISKSVMNTDLEHFKDRILEEKGHVQTEIDKLRDERYMLKQAIARDRSVYLEQRKRERLPLFGPGAVGAIAASLTIGMMQLVLVFLV